VVSYTERSFRQNPLIVDQTELQRAKLGIQGPHSRAATPPPGAGRRALPVSHMPVNQAEAAGFTGALARRTGLFVVSYAPLAAIVVVARWPTGWSMPDLLPLALWLAAVASVLAFPLASSFVPADRPSRVLAGALILAAALAVLGGILGWHEPMGLSAPTAGSSAAAAGAGFAFCVAAVELVVLMLLTARRPATASWQVRHPGEPGGAVAEYVGTYLFPLWVLFAHVHKWWVGPLLAIYPFIVYLAFVRSHKFVLVNPMLNLLRFRLYDVRLQAQGDGQRHVLLISRVALAPETRVKAVQLGDDCYVGRRPGNGGEARSR
jgi:hypothetical protein